MSGITITPDNGHWERYQPQLLEGIDREAAQLAGEIDWPNDPRVVNSEVRLRERDGNGLRAQLRFYQGFRLDMLSLDQEDTSPFSTHLGKSGGLYHPREDQSGKFMVPAMLHCPSEDDLERLLEQIRALRR